MSYLDRAHLPPEEKLAALKSAYAEHLEPVKPDPMAEKLLQLDEEVDKFFLPDSLIKPTDRYIYIRDFSKAIGIKLTEKEIHQKLWQGRKRFEGVAEGFDPHVPIEVPKVDWAWDGLWRSSTQNLLVSLPKCGKTTLAIDAIAHWHRGNSEFLGHRFIGKCPPLIIVGTDMALSDWSPLLCRFGLAKKIDDDHIDLLDPIVKLFTADTPIHLDRDGLENLVNLAAENVGALWLFDSYSKLTAPLGLQESSAEISYPMQDLNEYLSPYKATQIVIHHSGKQKGASPVMASRGSTSLTAAVSQIISLKWFNREEDRNDKRILIETEGRSTDVSLLISQESQGFILEGTVEEEIEKQKYNEKLENLTDNQYEVLELITTSSKEGIEITTKDLKEQLGLSSKTALRTCRALVKKSFILERVGSNDKGKISFFKLKP